MIELIHKLWFIVLDIIVGLAYLVGFVLFLWIVYTIFGA